MYKVLIVEDHSLTRFGLKTALESKSYISEIFESTNAEEAVETVKNTHIDTVVMDLGLPNMNGIEAAREIHKINKEIKIIILTSHNNKQEVLQSVKAGARAYCSKDINPEQLAEVILSVTEGALWFDSKVADVIIDELLKGNNDYTISISEGFNLTDREKEVLNYICNGLNNSEISKILDVSVNTVKAHVSSIIQKLNVEDRTQVVVKAFKGELSL